MAEYPVHHIVLFKYKDTVDEKQKVEAAGKFKALAETCKKDGKTYIGKITSGELVTL